MVPNHRPGHNNLGPAARCMGYSRLHHFQRHVHVHHLRVGILKSVTLTQWISSATMEMSCWFNQQNSDENGDNPIQIQKKARLIKSNLYNIL